MQEHGSDERQYGSDPVNTPNRLKMGDFIGNRSHSQDEGLESLRRKKLIEKDQGVKPDDENRKKWKTGCGILIPEGK